MAKIKIDDKRIRDLNDKFRSNGSLRTGAIIKLAPEGTERPAAGWYVSSTGDITLDGDQSFDRVLTIDGLVAHESSHSLWSNWLTMDLIRSGRITMPELGVVKTLEEARIEAQSVRLSAANRTRLRACYGHLLADNFADPANYVSVAGAVTCWALAWGRTHSAVVDHVELETIDKMMRDRFGDFPMDIFDDLLGEFCTLDFGYWSHRWTGIDARAIEIAKEWLDLVKQLQESEGEMDTEDIMVNIVRAILGEEDGDCDSMGGGEGGDESADAASGEGEGEGDDLSGPTGFGDSGAEEKQGWADEFVKAVEDVSGDPKRKPDVKRMSPRAAEARIWKERRSGSNWILATPEPRHARMVTRLARALQRDATPAVVRTRVSSQLPPGRLHGRGAMAAAADRAGGRITTATPWRASKRHSVVRPPVIIGVATDTSGSMKRYTNMLGEVAYVMAHGSKSVNAKFAAVTFGWTAEPVVRVGETPDKIRVRSANSGQEAFDHGMAALDGPLRLTDDSVIGRKLLVVVSDGHLVIDGEIDRAVQWLKALEQGGTDVIWVGDEGYGQMGRSAEADGVKNVRWVGALSTAEEFVDAILDNLRKG